MKNLKYILLLPLMPLLYWLGTERYFRVIRYTPKNKSYNASVELEKLFSIAKDSPTHDDLEHVLAFFVDSNEDKYKALTKEFKIRWYKFWWFGFHYRVKAWIKDVKNATTADKLSAYEGLFNEAQKKNPTIIKMIRV